MKFVTSLSPSNTSYDRQMESLKTWIKYGEILSFNNKEEIEKLKEKFDFVSFIEMNNTAIDKYGKNYIYISDMMDYLTDNEDVYCLINSDISIIGEINFDNYIKDGLTFISRYNFKNETKDAKLESFGFDVFIFSNKHLSIFKKEEIYSIGIPWWDYFVPYMFMINNIQLYYSDDKCFFHKEHEINWNQDYWNKIRVDFYKRFKLNNNVHPSVIPNILKNKAEKI